MLDRRGRGVPDANHSPSTPGALFDVLGAISVSTVVSLISERCTDDRILGVSGRFWCNFHSGYCVNRILVGVVMAFLLSVDARQFR